MPMPKTSSASTRVAGINSWEDSTGGFVALPLISTFAGLHYSMTDYGMSRVYFHEGDESFIFASEAKSLLRVRPLYGPLNPRPWLNLFARTV